MASYIHPTAVVEDGVEMGADCEIHALAVVRRHTVLADRVVVHPGAVVGGDPQYLKFEPATISGVRIGSGTTLREHVTINRSIHAGASTLIGAGGFLMAGVHVGHDCVVGNQVVLANNVLLAGHVSIGDFTFVGGGAAFHQFARIGESVMVAGLSRITRDLAPFLLVAERDEVVGLNLIGLKRRGFSREVIRELKEAFRTVFLTPGNIREVAGVELGAARFATEEARRFLEFFSGGKRSFARPQRGESKEAREDD